MSISESTLKLNTPLTEEQMARVFRCPTALATGTSKFNIPKDSLARIKAEQKDHQNSFRVQKTEGTEGTV